LTAAVVDADDGGDEDVEPITSEMEEFVSNVRSSLWDCSSSNFSFDLFLRRKTITRAIAMTATMMPIMTGEIEESPTPDPKNPPEVLLDCTSDW